MEDNNNYETARFKELSLDDLENIAGGRGITQSEKNDYEATYRKYQRTYSMLSRNGRGNEAFKLFNSFANERYRWEKDKICGQRSKIRKDKRRLAFWLGR